MADAEQFKETSPKRYQEAVSVAQELQKRSESNLRHMKGLLAYYRNNPVYAHDVAVDLRSLDPSKPVTVKLMRQPPSTGSLQAPPSLDNVIPTREKYIEELKTLQRELVVTQAALRRLTRSVQADLRLRKQWEYEADAAVNRAEDRAHGFLKDTLSEGLFNLLKWKFRDSPNRVSELEKFGTLISVKSFADWAKIDRHSWEEIGQQLISAVQGSTLGPEAQVVVDSMQHMINSTYDITAWFASWHRIDQLDKNADSYLVAVNKSAEHMRKIVNRIKEIQAQLGNGRKILIKGGSLMKKILITFCIAALFVFGSSVYAEQGRVTKVSREKWEKLTPAQKERFKKAGKEAQSAAQDSIKDYNQVEKGANQLKDNVINPPLGNAIKEMGKKIDEKLGGPKVRTPAAVAGSRG